MIIVKKNNQSGGFTLIELLVVIAIIGVLASIVLASLNVARRKSRDARRLVDLKQLRDAMDLSYDLNKSYPIGTGTCNDTASYGLEVLVPTFIPAISGDPLSGAAARYCYSYASSDSSNADGFHMGATMEGESNSALNNDRDCNSTVASGCGTSAYIGKPFDGTADSAGSKCITEHASKNGCYDITN